MSNSLSLILLIAAIAVLVFLSYRNLGQVIAPLICVAIVSLVAKSGFTEAFFNIFPKEAADFFTRMLLPVMSGAVLGEVMSASGAGRSIGITITKKLGRDNAPYVIMITSFIVSLSGMSSSMFAVAALSHVVMKEANLPSYIGMVCFFGFKEFTGFAMPGLPHNANLLATTFLGTDLYAGGIPGICALLFGWLFTILYVRYLVKQARKNNKGYDVFFDKNTPDTAKKSMTNESQPYPPFFKAVIPFLCVLIVTYILQKVFAVKSAPAAFMTQTLAIVLMYLLCRKTFNTDKKEALISGVKRGAEFLISASCLVGFASVVTDTAIFETLQNFLFRINLNPYLFTFIAVSLLACITCDPSSALLMFLQSFSKDLVTNAAVNISYIHRIAVITATGFDSLPQGGMTLLTLKAFGYDHKSGYKYLCVGSLIIPMCAGLLCTIISMIIA